MIEEGSVIPCEMFVHYYTSEKNYIHESRDRSLYINFNLKSQFPLRYLTVTIVYVNVEGQWL